MKNLNAVISLVLGLGSMFFFTACGSSTTAPNAQCGAGYTYTTTNGCQLTTTALNSPSSVQTSCASQAGTAYSATRNACLQQTTSCAGQYGIYNGQCESLGGSNPSLVNNHSPYEGSCQYGYVQTQAGCLQQGVCTSGYGFGYWGGYPYCFQATVTQ